MSGDEMSVEWAVQYRTYIGGKYDRTTWINGKTGKPYTEAQARAQAATFNKGKEQMTPARVASREVTKWTPRP